MVSNYKNCLVLLICAVFSHFRCISSAPAIAAVETEDNSRERSDAIYAEAGYLGAGVWNAGAGLWKYQDKSNSVNGINILRVDVEGGAGAMARASLVDATGEFGGGVYGNAGLTADTGLIFNKGIEAKVLGFGGKIGADGIQICFGVCLGISW